MTDSRGVYQYDAFARAVRGEDIGLAVSPQTVAQGLKIIAAMARAQTTGQTEAV